MKVRCGVATNGVNGSKYSFFQVDWVDLSDLGAVCLERGTHGSAEGGVS